MPKLLADTLLPITDEQLSELKIVSPSRDNIIAVVFDNFLRDQAIFNLIQSIFLYQPGVKIYIAEQSVYHPNTQKLYDMMIEKGHEIIYCGFDCGISVARNTAIKKVNEPYIFVADSDNLFTKKTKLKKLINILEKNPELGFLSLYEYDDDKLNPYEINLVRKEDKLFYENISLDDEIRNNDFFYCDYTMNVGMSRKELFDEVVYDNEMKLAEHLDFFLQIKYNTKWKVGCATKISINNQNIPLKNELYDQYRCRNKMYWKLYINKWHLTEINKYILSAERYVTDIETKPIKIIENIISPVKNTTDKVNDLELFTDILEAHCIDYYLIKDTCLQYVNHSPFSNDIYIAARLNPNVIIELRKKYKQISENIFTKNNIIFNVSPDVPKNSKEHYIIGKKKYKIPCPVLKYLIRLYGDDWNKVKDLTCIK